MYPRTADKSMESQRVISLNVGGQLFTTSLATLKAVPESTLATMFSGAGLAKMAVDEAGRFFIDRDPKHFATILSFLRDAECELPATARERKELLREAEFFEIGGLEDLLSTGACLGGFDGAADSNGAGGSASPLAIPHASEAYARILERARGEAGADNVARTEAALFALMYGPSLAPPPSPFTQQGVDGKGVPGPAPVGGHHARPGHGPPHYGRHHGHGHGHAHEHRLEEGAAIMQLGRRSLSLRGSSSQDVHPLDHAQELGAHCSGPELAAFIRRYFSVMQADFLRRGYLLSADRGSERVYLEIPVGAAAPDEASGVLFEGLVQSLAECCVAGEGRGDVRGVSFRKTYRKH